MKSSIFLISLNFTNSLIKTISSQTYPKLTQKNTEKLITSIHEIMIEFLDCLKRKQDISVKAMLSGGKMAITCTPTLM